MSRNLNLIKTSNKTMRDKAYELGATEIGVSKTKNKKYYVIYRGKIINFGEKGYSDYTKHKDPKRREAYHKRHKGIKKKDGSLAYKDKSGASFWSMKLLW